MFDYTINLEPNLTEEYVKAGFPGATDGKYYLIDEELKFSVKCLGGTDENYTGDVIRLGFAYDKKSLDGGLLETGQDADFTKSFSMRIWWWNRKLWTSSTVFPRTRSGM